MGCVVLLFSGATRAERTPGQDRPLGPKPSSGSAVNQNQPPPPGQYADRSGVSLVLVEALRRPLIDIAGREGVDLQQLVTMIADRKQRNATLTHALRTFVAAYLRAAPP